ncbi:MAG: AMP-binding protein [Proteobacteria bacterium]|nr:AMP-binding protein [Pseudomonadota bacterium]
MTSLEVPISAVPGITWPAVPDANSSEILALAYQLAQSEWWTPDLLVARQLAQAGELLAHATRSVPYYRDRIDGYISSTGTLTSERWRSTPILSRAVLQEYADRFKSEALPKAHAPVSQISTSGSTGRVVTILGTKMTALMNAAVGLRYHQWHQREFGKVVASIQVVKGNRAEAAAAGKASPWVPGYGGGTIFYCDINETVSAQAERLKKYNPSYLFAYPSTIDALLECLERTDLPALIHVATLGEALDAELRGRVRAVWDVPLVDAYSATEAGMLALQCPDHEHYHVQSERCILEVLREDGSACPPGETGRVVITDLHNFAVPLIRYEIGDYAEVGDLCSCGRGLPVLTRVAGRVRNMLTLPNGDKKWPRFGSARLAGIAPVKQAQLVQKSLNEIEARLSVERPLTLDETTKLRETILNGLGHSFDLTFSFVDVFPRTVNGKFEDFQSLL